MNGSEVVIAVAGSATALLNLLAAWRSVRQNEKAQAAALNSSQEVNRTLDSLEGSISGLATSIDQRFGSSQAQTSQVLQMYRDLVTRVVPKGPAQP